MKVQKKSAVYPLSLPIIIIIIEILYLNICAVVSEESKSENFKVLIVVSECRDTGVKNVSEFTARVNARPG